MFIVLFLTNLNASVHCSLRGKFGNSQPKLGTFLRDLKIRLTKTGKSQYLQSTALLCLVEFTEQFCFWQVCVPCETDHKRRQQER